MRTASESASDPRMQRRGGARGAPLPRLGAQALPKGRIVAAPAQEAEIPAFQGGRRVRGDQGGLGEKGAGTAHGVEQRAAALVDVRPAGAQQHGGGDIFLERGAAALESIAAPVQALAGEVHRQQCGVALDMQMQQHVGAFRLDVRAFAGGVAQIVAHRVLQQLRTIQGVTDGFVAAAAIAGERRPRGQMFAPVDAFDAFIHRLRTARVEGSQAQQHAGCGARPQAGAVPASSVPMEFHVVAAFANIVRPERASSSASTEAAPTGAVAIQ